jgi:predicted methyltransferase
MTADVDGKVDAVLLIRALHNLARFENDGGYLSIALKEIYRALKPGGVVGVVQHSGPEGDADTWLDGSHGYLKKSTVLEFMEKAGYKFVAESEVNLNSADRRTEGDIVWRLPPSLVTSKEDPALRKKLESIGETTRMTLLFRKPG